MKKRILSLLLVLLLLLPAIPAMPTEAAELPEGTANLDFSFTSIDGESVSTKSNGKPKLIVFFMPGCSRCKYTLQDFSSSSWLANGEADVCAIDFRGYTQEEIREFQETNCPEGLIQFVADDTGNATFAVYDYLHADGNTSGTIATPVVAMVDVNNNLRYVVSGRTVYASEIEADYLPNLKGGNSGDEGNTPGGDEGNTPGGDEGSTPDDGNKPGDGSDDTISGNKPGEGNTPGGDEGNKPGEGNTPGGDEGNTPGGDENNTPGENKPSGNVQAASTSAAAEEVKAPEIPSTSSVGTVKTSVAGAYLATNVNGSIVATAEADIAKNYGLADNEKVYGKFSDFSAKKSPLAKAAMDAAVAEQKAVAGPMLNIEFGKMSAGKYTQLPSDGAAIRIVLGIPKNFKQADKTYAVICVRAGGAYTVLKDLDNDANTVTFDTTGGAGVYAVIKY